MRTVKVVLGFLLIILLVPSLSYAETQKTIPDNENIKDFAYVYNTGITEVKFMNAKIIHIKKINNDINLLLFKDPRVRMFVTTNRLGNIDNIIFEADKKDLAKENSNNEDHIISRIYTRLLEMFNYPFEPEYEKKASELIRNIYFKPFNCDDVYTIYNPTSKSTYYFHQHISSDGEYVGYILTSSIAIKQKNL